MSASRGTILLVSHAYPPRSSQGSTRPAGLAKYLTRLGYRVLVLTSGAGAGVVPDEPAARVVRTRDLLSTRLNWRRANIDSHEGRADGFYSSEPSFLSTVLIPDVAAISWAPFATAAALRLAREERVDCVITTSIPRSAHLVGLRLRRAGVPWVADLRDGWRFEWPSPFRWRTLHRLDAWLERTTLRRADAVTSVSDPITSDLRGRVGVVDAVTVMNGYDSEGMEPAGGGAGLDPTRHSMVYTGRFAAGGRSLDVVTAGLTRMARRYPDEAAGFELVVAGPLTRAEAELLDSASVEPAVVRGVGTLPRAGALALQSEADSLLVATDGARTGELPGKLFEYLRAGNPVLVLGDQAECARVVAGAGAGFAVAARDEEAIAAAFRRLAAGERPGHDPMRLAEARRGMTHEAMAQRMAEVVESARARSG